MTTPSSMCIAAGIQPDEGIFKMVAGEFFAAGLGEDDGYGCSMYRRQGCCASDLSTCQTSVVIADDLLRCPVIGNPQGRNISCQPRQPRSHAGRAPSLLTIEPLPERSFHGSVNV